MSDHVDTKLLLLYLLNELDEPLCLQIQSHLSHCDHCQKELNALKVWKDETAQSPRLKPGFDVLQRNRKKLMERLRHNERQASQSMVDKILAMLVVSPSQPKWALVAAVFVIGVFLGQWNQIFTKEQTIVNELAVNSASMTGHFKVEALDSREGDLKVQFSSVSNHVIEGNIQDPDMQFLLSYALVHLDQDNVRLRCVNLLQQAANGEIVQNALYHAVQQDNNPGVRLKAIRILKRLPLTEPLKKVLLNVFFQEENTGIRLEAKKALKGRVTPKLLETFQVKIQNTSIESIKNQSDEIVYTL